MNEAKTGPSKLVARAVAGEEVILTNREKARTPVARIVLIQQADHAAKEKLTGRPIGLFKGQFEIPPEFFDPMSDEGTCSLGGLAIVSILGLITTAIPRNLSEASPGHAHGSLGDA